jgi:serine/threonine-protein kinase
MKRFLRPRLLPRIALALAAVGLLPVAVTSFGLVDLNQEALEKQVLTTHTVAARTAAARAGAFLTSRLALARGAAASTALAEPQSPAAQDLLRSSLAAWADFGVLALAVVSDAGEEVVRAQLRGEPARRAEAALRQEGAGEILSLPGMPPVPPVIRIEVPLAGAAGRLRLVADGGALLEAVSPAELGDEAHLVLVGGDGAVVAGSLPSLAGFPPEFLHKALSRKIVGAERYRDAGGRPFLGAYFPVAVTGVDWVVVSRQPSAAAEALALRIRRRSGLAIAAAVAMTLLLSAAAWGSVVRPIRELAAAQAKLAGLAPAARDGDEIGALRRTFAALQKSLADRDALEDVWLGRYRVLECIGTGAMGTVFRAWDPKLERTVALKTVRVGEGFDSPERKRLADTLLREAVTVARLSHPNVVAVYDLEDTPEGAFVAMEYVDGTTLEELLWSRTRLTPEQAVPLGAAIARGLAAAHARGIVHRDVKPSNVLLGRDGSVKVSDFGIAGYVASTSQAANVVFGTPGYVPPESLQGRGYGLAGDLFGLGVVLYECLTGARPFSGVKLSDVAQATLMNPVQPLAGQVPAMPPVLESLVLRLLEREPEHRPQDAAEVAAELERLAAAQGLRWTLPAAPAAASPSPPPAAVSGQWIPTTRPVSGQSPRFGTTPQ